MNIDPAALIRAVFAPIVTTDGKSYPSAFAPVSVVGVKGRTVHVRLSGDPSWSDLAPDLLGPLGACDEFRLSGRDLFARMKTPAQIDADCDATDYDEANGGFTTSGFPDLGAMMIKKAATPKAERKRGPLYTAIADYIEASDETTFQRYALVGAVKALLEKDGREVRADSLARTLDTQIVGTLLEVVPDTDGETLQLKGDDNG